MSRLFSAHVFDTPVARPASECPVEDWLAFLGHRWNAAVLWHLSAAPMRFGALVDHLPGITPKVLSERLQGLERRGLIMRSEKQTFPRSVIYGLTKDGLEIISIIRLLEPWAKSRSGRPEAA